MFEVDSTPLKEISLEHILLGSAVIWAVWTQVWVPLRNAHAKKELRANKTEDRLANVERQVEERVHKEDFKNLEHKVDQDISILERMERKLDDFMQTVGLTNQGFEGRIARLEERKERRDD